MVVGMVATVAIGSREARMAEKALTGGLLATMVLNRRVTRHMVVRVLRRMICVMLSPNMESVLMDHGAASAITKNRSLASIRLWRRSLIVSSREWRT